MENTKIPGYNIAEAREIARKYGAQIIAKMSANMHQQGLVDKGTLLNSLKFGVRTRNGEVDRVQFQYEFYGAIWENGADNVFGKGIHLNPRKWRNDVIEQIRPDLIQDFGEYYAGIIINELALEDIQLKH